MEAAVVSTRTGIVGCSVDSNDTTIEALSCQKKKGAKKRNAPSRFHARGSVATHSWLFMPSIAASASASVEKRTNPNPRLRLVSLSLITICSNMISGMPGRSCRMEALTASSMVPNFSNPERRVSSVVCHARPLHISLT